MPEEGTEKLSDEALRELQEQRQQARLRRAAEVLRAERVMLIPMEPVILGGRILPGPLRLTCEEEAPAELAQDWQQQLAHILAEPPAPSDGKP